MNKKKIILKLMNMVARSKNDLQFQEKCFGEDLTNLKLAFHLNLRIIFVSKLQHELVLFLKGMIFIFQRWSTTSFFQI